MTMSRDVLVSVLKGHLPLIKDAGVWTSLADHIQQLVDSGQLEPRNRIKSRDLRYDRFGDPISAYDLSSPHHPALRLRK